MTTQHPAPAPRDHARRAGLDIRRWFVQTGRLTVDSTVPTIQRAIDAACAERDARIAKLERVLNACDETDASDWWRRKRDRALRGWKGGE